MSVETNTNTIQYNTIRSKDRSLEFFLFPPGNTSFLLWERKGVRCQWGREREREREREKGGGEGTTGFAHPEKSDRVFQAWTRFSPVRWIGTIGFSATKPFRKLYGLFLTWWSINPLRITPQSLFSGPPDQSHWMFAESLIQEWSGRVFWYAAWRHYANG